MVRLISSIFKHTQRIIVRSNFKSSAPFVFGQKSICTCSTLNKLVSVKTPNFPDSISEGDVKWTKSLGSTVKTDDVIGEIETDKTSLPILSPCTGILKEYLTPEGSKVLKGQIVCKIDECEIKESQKTEPTQSQTHQKVEKVESKPATEKKVDPSQISFSTTTTAVNSVTDERTESRVQMTRMRQTISSRLKESQNVNAMLTTFNEVDMSTAMDVRNKYKDRCLKEHGIKLGFMSMFLSASIYALKQQPIINAVISGNEIVYRNYIDISVAVSSPKGLVVPVIRNAEKMSMIQLEKALMSVADKARKGQLTLEDMEGGTFTISNGGVFGSMMSTPIINMPQSAILGMHSIKERPVAINGKVEIRPIMYVALTYDHRLVDGREAVIFLKSIKDVVEDPTTILMGL